MRRLSGLIGLVATGCVVEQPARTERHVDDCEVRSYFVDADGDGYGDGERAAVMGCDAPEGWVADGSDCADDDDTVFPGAPEVCDGRDDDCDGLVDDGLVLGDYYPDADGDGYGDENAEPRPSCGVPQDLVANGLDCDDGAARVSPAAAERCNGLDDDCDGVVDDGIGAPRTNLALDKAVSGSGVSTAARLHEVNDGVRSTEPGHGWISDDVAGPTYLELDLGELASVGRVDVVTSEGYAVDRFDVEIHDGTDWVFVDGVRGNTDLHTVVTFPSITTDRLRLTNLIGPPHQPRHARIHEIEVYANQARDASVTGSSTHPGYGAARTVDGDRGSVLGGASSWTNDGHGTLPAMLQLDFEGCRSVERLELFTTASYEIADYDVEVWDGAAWEVVAQSRDNTATHVVHGGLVVHTDRVRVVATSGPSIQPTYARINEIELY